MPNALEWMERVRNRPRLEAADNRLVTVEEAASFLHISRAHLNKLLMSGMIPSLKIGKFRRIFASDLFDWLNRQIEIEQDRLANHPTQHQLRKLNLAHDLVRNLLHKLRNPNDT